jgi:hypothetical protein
MIGIIVVIQFLLTVGVLAYVVLDYLKKYKHMNDSIEEVKSKIGSIVREVNKLEIKIT